MRIDWTAEAIADLSRLYRFLEPVNPAAAARAVQMLEAAPDLLARYPRIGRQLRRYLPRQVRRWFVRDYELRYEIVGDAIIILNLWHVREDR